MPIAILIDGYFMLKENTNTTTEMKQAKLRLDQ